MNKERLLKILLLPHTTEKTMRCLSDRQYALRVLLDATKLEIKLAVELLFNVKVCSVRTLQVKSKQRRRGRTIGRTQRWKKAYVTLEEGHEIDAFTEAG